MIDGIYEALQNFGFEGGNLLEPACGVGNFFGRLPDEVRKDTNLYGVEIDSISGRIAQQLYPTADITISGFEKNEFQNGSFDVVVDNVSVTYGEYSIFQSNKIAFEYQSFICLMPLLILQGHFSCFSGACRSACNRCEYHEG